MTHVQSQLVVTIAKQRPLVHMDVKNAFLDGLYIRMYKMKRPPCTSTPLQKVFLFHHALYDLKHTPRAWFATLSFFIIQLDFTSSSHNTTIFMRQTPKILFFFFSMLMICLLLAMILELYQTCNIILVNT